MDKCPKCNTDNLESYWCQEKDPETKKDRWVCAYCYNGSYTTKQVERIRNKKW